jgi:serine/threonine protein kinase
MRRLTSTPPELPGYTFVRLLGSGGFADVFLYEQQLPKRSVAVKVLLTDSVDDAARTRFVAEANVMAQLSAHPYIVTIYQADISADERPYLVMEYCSGPSLGDRFKRERFTVEDALRTGVRLSSAVATAHSVGILHRDIKPANVLTTDFGWPALTDFGIASTLEELPVHTTSLSDLRGGVTDTGTSGSRSIGLSVPWSPAEMFEDDPQPDVRSDVFSLAATIHTLLAGRTPFEVPGRSNGTLDLIGRIERGIVTPIGRDDLPPTLGTVLNKGMATRRDDRFATAVDFARALQRVELELGFAPTSIDVPNLRVVDERPVSAQTEDETRVRSVATIDAQGIGSPPPTPPQGRVVRADAAAKIGTPPRAESRVEAEPTRIRGGMPAIDPDAGAAPVPVESTVVRPRTVSVSPAEASSTAESSAEDGVGADVSQDAGSRRPRWMVPVIATAAALVVLAGILVAVLVPALAPTTSATDRPGSEQDGQIDVSVVPPPTLVSATRSADGTTATFIWKTAGAKQGDQYQWGRDGTNDPKTVTAKPQAQVSGLTAGAGVCITVETVRAGRTSAELKACSQ